MKTLVIFTGTGIEGQPRRHFSEISTKIGKN